jgi:hypothetical protein
MANARAKQLFERLLKADSEAAVIDILRDSGYWDDPSAWRFYGDKPRNWATVGGQQSGPDQALVEKLTNAIDTKLIAAARIRNQLEGPSAPKLLFKARDLFFGEQMKDVETLSKSITVAATGRRQRPSITIVDDGEGVTPAGMPKTILSLHEGNKDTIPFVQGKFNMGGSGVLEFCGIEHNVELVLSRRNPQLLAPDATAEDRKWNFTVIRREDPGGDSPRSSRFTYLAPGPVAADGKRSLLTFDAPTLPIFPEKNQAYAREAPWGTLFKLYEYGTRAVTNMMLEDGLMMKIRLLLPEPALPIRFHECRDYAGDPARSFDTPMAGLIYTLEEDRKNPKRRNVEWFDKFDLDVDGEKFTVRIYLLRKQAKDEKKNPAENYRKDEGVIFTYNGQAQKVYTKDFFRRKRVKQDYLWNSLLVFVDCTTMGVRPHEKLFMANRESLRDVPLKRRLERTLEDKLRNHKELEEIAHARRKGELSESPEVSETFEKFVEDMVKKHPILEQILGPGFRIPNPVKPHLVEAAENSFQGKRFPTKFHCRGSQPGKEMVRDAHLKSQVRVAFETDAENDYFRRDEEPGEFQLFQLVDGELKPARNWGTPNLFNGSANLTISSLPDGVKIGDTLAYEAQTTDPSRIEPFRNRFTLTVRAERSSREPVPPPPTKPHEEPTGKEGKDKPDDTRLNVPKPVEIREPAWPNQDPPFDRFTAMRIKRPPGAPEDAHVYDYSINMDNVFLRHAINAQPKRAMQHRDRFKFGMTCIALSLIRHDLERKRRDGEANENGDDEESKPGQQDIHDAVADVTSALAPFLLPLVDSLSKITETVESLSESAGEAA